MKPLVETRSSVFKAVLLSFVLGMSAGVINFFSALSAEFKIEQQRQSEISDLNFERIVALAKSSNGTVAELEKFARTATILRPSLVSLDVSVRGQPIVDWKRARQTSSRPILDALTERWITYERMDTGTGVYLRGVKDSHIAYRYFVDRQWVNARTALLRTLLIMAVVWACVYLFLARPLRKIRTQINSRNFIDEGLRLGDESGAEFVDLADGINEVLARDQLLKKRNQRLFHALMNTHEACVIYTAKDGLALFINHAAMDILSGQREDWIGTPVYKMSSNTDFDTYKAGQQQLARDGHLRQVRKIISEDGETRSFEVTTSQTIIDEEKINTMLIRQIESPQAAITQSQVNDLRRMIGGISHELNNSLTVIRGSLELELELESSPTKNRTTGTIQKAKERVDGVSALIQRLMAYAQVTNNENVRIRVEEALSSIIDDQSKLARQYDLQLSATEETQRTEIFMDEDAFSFIMRELIQNAVNASNPGTLILVSLDIEHLETSQVIGSHALPAGGYIKIVVGDQGKGMTKREVAAAFDPFYSVSRDPGRGIGLSAVQSSVEVAGGAVDIESAPGVGTNVAVFLPIAEKATADSSSADQICYV